MNPDYPYKEAEGCLPPPLSRAGGVVGCFCNLISPLLTPRGRLKIAQGADCPRRKRRLMDTMNRARILYILYYIVHQGCVKRWCVLTLSGRA